MSQAASPPAAAEALSSKSLVADAQPPPVVHSIDMADNVKEDLFKLARHSIAQASTHKDRAQMIKKALDKFHGPGKWHVVVGLSFGSYVTHQTGAFAFFTIDGVSFLVFKG